jgi:hypothetical protein
MVNLKRTCASVTQESLGRSPPSIGDNSILRLKKNFPVGQLENVALIALQHLLPSIEPLFGRLVQAGFAPRNIFILGKPYSTVPEIAAKLISMGCYVHLPGEGFFAEEDYAARFRRLTQKFLLTVDSKLDESITKIVVLDEGGWLRSDLPYSSLTGHRVIAIEHTMQGLMTVPAGATAIPTILMATSAAKTRFESPIIANAIVDRLRASIKELNRFRVGVIGLGNLGKAVVKSLCQRGQSQVWGFDLDRSKSRVINYVEHVARVSELIESCDVILGCTGRNAISSLNTLRKEGQFRWLASCSSGNVEFHQVFKLLSSRNPKFRLDPFSDVGGRIGFRDVMLLNGGFPLNFDRKFEYEPAPLIQLTRELSFASVLQAALCVSDEILSESIMLDPAVQQMLVHEWLVNPEAKVLFPEFPNWHIGDLGWWKKHSTGETIETSLSDFIYLE